MRKQYLEGYYRSEENSSSSKRVSTSTEDQALKTIQSDDSDEEFIKTIDCPLKPSAKTRAGSASQLIDESPMIETAKMTNK